ncbi:hypothetical protein KKE45_03105 [Patescibacteria group bacterium]|nr:hypothetical protein [Patescibacteria group bacterium]
MFFYKNYGIRGIIQKTGKFIYRYLDSIFFSFKNFSGPVLSKRAKREGVGGKKFLPDCRKIFFSFYLPVEASTQAGKKKVHVGKLKNIKKIFLFCLPNFGGRKR